MIRRKPRARTHESEMILDNGLNMSAKDMMIAVKVVCGGPLLILLLPTPSSHTHIHHTTHNGKCATVATVGFGELTGDFVVSKLV